jgi:hypothetical protein
MLIGRNFHFPSSYEQLFLKGRVCLVLLVVGLREIPLGRMLWLRGQGELG